MKDNFQEGGDDIADQIDGKDHDMIEEVPVFLDKFYETQVHEIDGETLNETQLM